MSDRDESINRFSKLLYDECREEYGRLIRLIIGLSAGAITIVGAVLRTETKPSVMLLYSLILYLISLGCGVFIQYRLMLAPKEELKRLAYETERDSVRFSGNIPKELYDTINKPLKILMFFIQTVIFGLANIFLFVHFLQPN